MSRVLCVLLASLVLALPAVSLAQTAAQTALPGPTDDATLGSKPPRIRSKQEIGDAMRQGVVLMLAGPKATAITPVGYGFALTSEFMITASHLFPEDTLCKVRALGSDRESFCHVRRRDALHDLALVGIEQYSDDIHPAPIPLNHSTAADGPVYLLQTESPPLVEGSIHFAASAGGEAHLEISEASTKIAIGTPVIDIHGKVVALVSGAGNGASVSALPVEALDIFTKPLQGRAKEYFQFGMDELKGSHYENARSDFTVAASADPSFLIAQLYVGLVASELVFAHRNIADDNLRMAHFALDAFGTVLDDHPDNLVSIRKTAELYFNIDDFDHAREWQQKLLQITPNDFKANLDLGVFDWYQANENATAALSKAGLEEDYEGNPAMPPRVCHGLRRTNQHLIEDGIASMKQALAIHPENTDAAGYMNALFRRKADLDCADPATRRLDLATANKWLAKSNGFRPEKPEIGVVGGMATSP